MCRPSPRLCLGALALALVVALVGCWASPQPIRGSAQDLAAQDAGRKQELDARADTSARDAAEARARADALAAEAQADPTPARIARAADARVAAAVAEALAKADQERADQAAKAAAASAELGRRERAAEEADKDFRAWVRLCRLVGLGTVIAGIVIGALLARVAGPGEGAKVGGLLAAVGCIVIALGPATAWLPWVVVPAGVVALGRWALVHERHRREHEDLRREHDGLHQVSAALSRTVDALEGQAATTVADAKRDLGHAFAAAGDAARARLVAARQAWRLAASTTHAVAVSPQDAPTDVITREPGKG